MNEDNRPLAKNHISVDCVVVGFSEDKLKVLLVKQDEAKDVYNKLPGNLIYQDENLDEAAQRTLLELTGVENNSLMQFKAYGSGGRTQNQEDVLWLEKTDNIKVESIVTIAYFTVVRKLKTPNTEYNANWINIDEVNSLAFDHNSILNDAIKHLKNYAEKNPIILFELLPKKFTVSQLRILYEIISGRSLDVRNFQKKLTSMDYVIPLDEFQKNVSHRAARYYSFNKAKYIKTYNTRSLFKL